LTQIAASFSIPEFLYEEGSFGVFVLVTLILGGGAAGAARVDRVEVQSGRRFHREPITSGSVRVGLEPRARGRAARTYSRGMVQRLALARALLTRPSLLLLDEPFTGLDRDGALALGEQLGVLRDAGAIVVVVTHDLEAIAGRADHVAILRRGQLVFEDRGTYSYERMKDLYHHHAN